MNTTDANPLAFLDIPILFGSFLVHSGILNEKQVADAIAVQKEINGCTACALVEQGILSADDFRRLRAYQREHAVTIAEALHALELLSPADYARFKVAVHKNLFRLGEVLVKQGKLTREQLDEALEQHRKHQSHSAA